MCDWEVDLQIKNAVFNIDERTAKLLTGILAFGKLNKEVPNKSANLFFYIVLVLLQFPVKFLYVF